MLTIQEVPASELGRWYSAVEADFDKRELIPVSATRRAVRRGDAEFLIFCDEQSGVPQGYALCGIRNLYGYVMLKYFGILQWYQGKGLGVEAMRLLHKRYADRQGMMAELTVFDDSGDGEYLRKLRRFFARFGYEEIPCAYRIGGRTPILTVKPIRSRADIRPVAERIAMDFYRRLLQGSARERMIDR